MTTTAGARRRFSTRQKASATRHAIETAWPRSLRFLTLTLANEAFRLHGDRVAMLAAGAARDEPQVERVVLRIQASQPGPPATRRRRTSTCASWETPRVGAATSADGRGYRLGYGLTVAQGGALRELDRPESVQSRICGTDKITAPAVCAAVIRGRDRHVTRILHG